MTQRVETVGNLEEDELSSVGSSVETLSKDSENDKSDPRVKKEVASRNDDIIKSITIYD